VTDYQPIPCAQHERLEFSVLRKTPLHLVYLDGSEEVSCTVLPLDVATRNRAEWMKFRCEETGEVVEIRLDAIVSVHEAR
jgi:Rho-binding antiterminator